MNLVLPRILTALGVASLLAACGSSTGTAPVPSAAGGNLTQQSVAQAPTSTTRTVDHHQKKKHSDLSADPASIAFAAGDSAPQTVKITSKRNGKFDVTIAGTGNCPTVSPATLTFKRTEQEGEHDGDHQDSSGGTSTITVTPAGAGPASCTITIAKPDGDAGDDAAEHETEHGGASLTIPVTVAAPSPSPSPTPTLAPTPVPTATPAPTPSPSPTPGR